MPGGKRKCTDRVVLPWPFPATGGSWFTAQSRIIPALRRCRNYTCGRWIDRKLRPSPGQRAHQSVSVAGQPLDRILGRQQVEKIPIEGGIANLVCQVSLLYGASWGRDNSIVFTDGWSSGLSWISAEGGKPETLTKPDHPGIRSTATLLRDRSLWMPLR
jgi:hypothetical protein